MGKRHDTPASPALDPSAYVMTSAALATDVVEWLRRVQSQDWRLVTLGHHALDRDIAIYPGSLTGILGRPSMGKSMVCKWIARREVRGIVESGREGECVVYVTLEEAPAVIGMALDGWDLSIQDVVRGRFDLEDATRRALYLAKLPLFLIRHPGLLAGRVAPALTPQRLYESIEQLVADYPSDPAKPRMRPTLVILDYVQLLQGDDLAMTEQTKTAQVTAAIEGAKNLAVRLQVPVVMAVQAGRQTDHRADFMPTMTDAQWASAIEQACDLVLGVHRPVRRDDLADDLGSGGPVHVKVNGKSYLVNNRLMVLGLVKQRAGKGTGRYPVYMDPVDLELHEMADERTTPRTFVEATEGAFS